MHFNATILNLTIEYKYSVSIAKSQINASMVKAIKPLMCSASTIDNEIFDSENFIAGASYFIIVSQIGYFLCCAALFFSVKLQANCFKTKRKPAYSQINVVRSANFHYY